MTGPQPHPEPGASQVAIAPGVVLPASALNWRFSRSSGPGGQNVNKVASKAELTVAMEDLAPHLPLWAIRRLEQLAGKRLVGQTVRLSSEAARSQLANRRACLIKLRGLIVEAQNRPKTRRPTRPSAGAKRRRIEQKKQRGQIKITRQTPHHDP